MEQDTQESQDFLNMLAVAICRLSVLLTDKTKLKAAADKVASYLDDPGSLQSVGFASDRTYSRLPVCYGSEVMTEADVAQRLKHQGRAADAIENIVDSLVPFHNNYHDDHGQFADMGAGLHQIRSELSAGKPRRASQILALKNAVVAKSGDIRGIKRVLDSKVKPAIKSKGNRLAERIVAYLHAEKSNDS